MKLECGLILDDLLMGGEVEEIESSFIREIKRLIRVFNITKVNKLLIR